ncbi:hypothetical protein N9N13_05810 [Opitutales bacterium]|nr:hypothetical protein [Opitutales bacterium]
MNKFFLFFFLFSSLNFFGQSQNKRNVFFDEMDRRAQDLAQRLAEIGGTDPLVLERPNPPPEPIAPVLSTPPTPQEEFDALPDTGFQDNEVNSMKVLSEEVSNFENEQIKSHQIEKKEVLLMEFHLGEYFIQPFFGAVFPTSSISYSNSLAESKINVDDFGHSLGLGFGTRWGNFETSLAFAYSTFDFQRSTLRLPVGSVTVDGGGFELLNLNLRLGYAIPVSEFFWFRFGGGMGFGHRKDYLDLSGGISSFDDKSVFTYDLLLSIGYSMKFGFDSYLGYRFTGASDNGGFDSVAMHMIELGLGANF